MPEIIPLDLPAAYWRGKAQQAHRSGSLAEAVRLYQAALRKHADNGIRRELAQVYADMRSLSTSDRLLLENLALDPDDTDSLYGLARNRSLAGDERAMADILDLYLRLAPCGEQADRARDILWQLPREKRPPRRMRRAQVRCDQALDHEDQPDRCLALARRSWRRGKTAEAAQLLSRLYLNKRQNRRALRYALAGCDLQPQDLGARLALAAALHRCGMDHACRQALVQARALGGEIQQTPLYCRSALLLGQADLAIAAAEDMLDQAPGSIDAMLLLAMALRVTGEDDARAAELLERAEALDGENPALDTLEVITQADAEAGSKALVQRLLSLRAPEAGQNPHRELVRLMRLPLPGMAELAVQLMINAGDTVGLRLALLENDLPPMADALILNALTQQGAPLPCLARVQGRLCLVPQKPRPPYDADLHDLVRRLLRLTRGGVELDTVVREVPAAWNRLPESARRHCAQSGDGVWPAAFAAYLCACEGNGDRADEWLNRCRRPARAGRAYMQLIRRSKRPYEMH